MPSATVRVWDISMARSASSKETRFASGSAQTIRDDGRQLKSENKSARQGAVILKNAAYCGM